MSDGDGPCDDALHRVKELMDENGPKGLGLPSIVEVTLGVEPDEELVGLVELAMKSLDGKPVSPATVVRGIINLHAWRQDRS